MGHLRLAKTPPEKITAQLRRLLGEHGEAALVDCLELIRAETVLPPTDCDALISEARALAERGVCVTRKQLAVNGNDLAALGLKGAELGGALEMLLEDVVEERVENERGALVDVVKGRFNV
jgi:tRNA nucleotidyltransferase (CCA-adding enzyme)